MDEVRVLVHRVLLAIASSLALSIAVVPAATAQNATSVCASTTGTGTDFSGQDLTDHNFSADLPGSLIGANFTGTKLSGAIFAGQDLSNARFENADLGPSKAPVNFTKSTLANTCFIGANLDQTDFSFATLTCVDFSGASLMKAQFGPLQDIVAGQDCRTKFIGATLDVHLISDDFAGASNWGKSDFTRANFQNLTPQTFNLRGKDITGAMLAQTNFTGIDMTGANLTDVDFTSATLTKAVLDNTALNGARLYQAQAQSASFVCAQGYGNSGGQTRVDGLPCPKAPTSSDPTAGVTFTFAGLKDTDLSAATLDHANFGGANLNGATLSGASLAQANLQSVSTPSGESGPANVQFAIFDHVNFTNTGLSSVDFSGGTLTGAVFDGTSLNGTNFTSANLPAASFQSATLQSVNFTLANLQSAEMSGVTIQAPGGGGGFGANFSCAQLGGIDLKDSNISATNFGNAVMPAADDCCPATSSQGQPWCGIVDATQETYGPVTFPVLNKPVTCPNGDTAKCSGTQWRLSSNWTTSNCNVDRVPQTLWSKPNCNGKPGDIVVFKDPSLKSCILEGLPGQTEVLLATAEQIAEVNCPGRGITDIGGLEAFISLTKLDLSGNQLPIFTLRFTANGSPVTSRLQSLDLSDNQLTTLDLSAHPALVSLSVENNKLGAITLNANAYLVVLDASHNQLKAFDLPIQTSLSYVDLSDNVLTSVLVLRNSDLSALTALSYLDLSHNTLTTIGSIQSIAANQQTGSGGALQSLYLGCNASFHCGDLGVYDGKTYPAAATSLCSAYDTATGAWTPLATPQCPPGS